MVWTVSDSANTESEKSSHFESLKLKVTSTIGYLLPFITSLPPLAAWSSFMTVPFIIYLLMMFGNISNPPLPDITRIGTLIMIICAGLGLFLLLYSVAHLWREKSSGLVVTGPYRICRHPQYFSLIIITMIMTYQSVWILEHTRGTGWLSADQTRILWILMLGAYVVIAWVEEMHLGKQFGEEWYEYRRNVGFLLPFIPLKSYLVEGLIAVIIPALILEGLLLLPVVL